MDLTRREFVKGGLASLGFLALPGGLFAVPTGWKPKGKKPNLVLGVMSDSHLRVGYDAVTPGRAFPLKYVQNAFRLFKSRNVDAFVHCGDAAHRGCVREWEFHKECLDEVFGKRGGPARIVIVGNHELFEYAKVWWPDNWQDRQINHDLAKNYERIWGLPYEDVQHWEVKGYHFFGRHWQTQEAALADFINANAGKYALAGVKPFFILSHARNHFACNARLKAFPNAIAFFGHWHQSNADWKSIYYDSFGSFFPNIEIGACRAEDGGNDLDHDEEASKGLRAKADKGEEKIHKAGFPSRQAMIVNVYDDMVVFERHEVGEGGKLGPDWVLLLGASSPSPFSRAELTKTVGSPEFGAKAKLETQKVSGNLRIKIPMADGNPDSRVYAYNVVVVGDDPKARLFKSVFFSGVNSGIGHEPNKGITAVEIPLSELPPGKTLTIAVRPVSSLGTKGKTIGMTMRV
jgi:predicted phosphodiesterase